ncbi:MAG: galactokinase [Gemmatimonadaceae bacterium]|nr:galactokinase [Gemmatimonadaceae bacterium]
MITPRTLPATARAAIAAFTAQFGTTPTWLIRAPGRVNLIGEHTDYNDGFVLPLAIDRAVWIALRPRDDARVNVFAVDKAERGTIDLRHFARGGPSWLEYLRGSAWALAESGAALVGWDGAMAGDVPLGAGLSSSAAVELATLRALTTTSQLPWSPATMATLGQRAENRWVGVNCGIMDQMISAAGEADHALLIDCRSLALTSVPLPAGYVVVVMDTGTRRGLVDSAYNERRHQCEAAARHFGVTALRDITEATFGTQADALDPLTRRRARHVITENARTVAAAERLRAGDAAAVGALMDASHQSLRDDFEVSSPALNQIVEIARRQPGCVGARMTGAGFGGCAVALVEAAAASAFTARVDAEYRASTSWTPSLYVTTAQAGASAHGLGGLPAAHP